MSVKHENIICIILLVPAFLLGGFLHVALYGVDFFDGICQIYYSGLAILWGISIDRRVTNKRIRALLFGMIGLAILMFTLQMCKYKFFAENPGALRYAWYGYYIPIIFAPLLMYRISLLIGRNEREQLVRRLSIGAYVLTVLLALLIMTNDIHQFVFHFPKGLETGSIDYSYGIGFYLIYFWVVVLYIASLVTIVKKCRVMDSKMMAWLPVLTTAIGVSCEIMNMLGTLKVNGISLWQLGELFFFCMSGFVEACFVVGLIPTNFGYERLMDLTNKPIIIEDNEGNIAYKSANYFEISNESEDYQVYTDKIKGGTVSLGLNMSVVNRLNRQIEETIEQINSRNEYLHSENDLKAEQSKINARNDLYDNMAKIMSPQIKEINRLLKEDEELTDANLKKIAVLNAYIKRRSNMELLRGDGDSLPLKELYLAMNESCDYIKLQGAEALVMPMADEQISGKNVIAVYDFFEKVVEESLDGLKSLMVTVSYNEGALKARLLVNCGGEDRVELLGIRENDADRAEIADVTEVSKAEEGGAE